MIYNDSPIIQFYANRSIFITGVTGFIGKVVVEKILRRCVDIKKIYVLIRPKEGELAHQRLVNIKSHPIFQQSSCIDLEKVIAMEGDITLENFGLSQCDSKILNNEVSVIYNAAATIKFNEDLKHALSINVLSVLHLINMCKSMPNLMAVIHVSTAYSNCDWKFIYEKIYFKDIDPLNLITRLNCLKAYIKDITPVIIKGYPNTYTYSKAMAEQLMGKSNGNLPIFIVRPSIVGAAWKEPEPGWIDNYNGTTGILAAMQAGNLNLMKANGDFKADIIPVDIVANVMISLPWYAKKYSIPNMTVFNCTSLKEVTWKEVCQNLNYSIDPVVVEGKQRSPIIFVNNNLYYFSLMGIKHLMPAIWADMYNRLLLRRAKSTRYYLKLIQTIEYLCYFTQHEWRFDNLNFCKLKNKLYIRDKALFNMEVEKLNWAHYLKDYCDGTRRFVRESNKRSRGAFVKRETFHIGNYYIFTIIFAVLSYIIYFSNQ